MPGNFREMVAKCDCSDCKDNCLRNLKRHMYAIFAITFHFSAFFLQNNGGKLDLQKEKALKSLLRAPYLAYSILF